MTAQSLPKSLLGLPAPAKLNLFLHVIGRREDGKHLLESIFVLVDLADTIDLTLREDGVIARTGDLCCDTEHDLCVRAARLLQSHTGVTLGADIAVTKRIPSGAGMGGGSSDAATVLIGLNRLWKLDLPVRELARLGEQLGADVPFFIHGQNAFVEGIGERITPLPVPTGTYALIWPGRSVSTAKIFASPFLTRDSESLKIAFFSDFLRNLWPELPGRNDLQSVAMELEPAISDALEALIPLGGEPRMTGSGSAVFTLVREGSEDVQPFLEKLPSGTRFSFLKGLPEHPLRVWTRES